MRAQDAGAGKLQGGHHRHIRHHVPWRQRHLAEVGGSGRRSRRSMSARNKGDSKVSSGEVGGAVNTVAK